MSAKVLVFGGRGWIGQQMCAHLRSQSVDYEEAKSRANDAAAVREEFKRVMPTHVMSFLGRTHGEYEGKHIPTIDFLEKPGGLVLNLRDNLASPLVLAKECEHIGAHFTYIGTGCIFESPDVHGVESESVPGFSDDALPNFFGSSYSTVKGVTDQLLPQLFPKVLNARIRMPITDTWNGRNFISKIATYESVCSIPNSMTVLDEALPLLWQQALARDGGTYNYTNPGVITHDECLAMYREVVDSSFEWKNFSLDEQAKILAAGRSNNKLNTNKVSKRAAELGVAWPDIKSSVRAVVTRMARNGSVPATVKGKPRAKL